MANKRRKPFYEKVWFWILTVILVVVAFGIGMIAGGGGDQLKNFFYEGTQLKRLFSKSEFKPEKVVKQYLEAIKKQDIEKASKLITDDSIEKEIKLKDTPEDKCVKNVFSKIKYSTGKVIKEKDSAIVKTSITSVDLTKIATKVLADALPKVMEQAFSDKGIDDEAQQQAIFDNLNKSINESGAPKVTTIVDIKVIKRNGKWRIEPNKDLANALSGNFYSIADGLANIDK